MKVEYLTKEDYERAEERGIKQHTVYQRVYDYGWSVEKAVTFIRPAPLWETWGLTAIENDVSYAMFQRRIRKGMTPEEAINLGRVIGGRKKIARIR